MKEMAGKTTNENQPRPARVPGFVNDKDIGVGDVVKNMTYALGIRPCGGCERRAAALNRLMVFTGRGK